MLLMVAVNGFMKICDTYHYIHECGIRTSVQPGSRKLTVYDLHRNIGLHFACHVCSWTRFSGETCSIFVLDQTLQVWSLNEHFSSGQNAL